METEISFDDLKKNGFPTRPLLLGKPYNFNLIHAVNPGEFYIRILDTEGARLKSTVENALIIYDEGKAGEPIAKAKLTKKMPVVHVTKKEGENYTSVSRAEVVSVVGNSSEVIVDLIDDGGRKTVPASSLYSSNTELLQLPKLAHCCKLSQIVPRDGASEWPKTVVYSTIFQGKETSLVRVTRMEEEKLIVYVERDGIDVGLELSVAQGWGELTPLPIHQSTNESAGKYPLFGFDPWIGQQISVFGTVAKKPLKTSENKNICCHLQLDPIATNKVLDHVASIPETNLKVVQKPPVVGDAVLVKYEELIYRATITRVGKTYSAKLVDYGEFVLVDKANIFEIPEEVLNVPEGATPCFLPELAGIPFTDALFQKLSEMVTDRDLYGCIGHPSFPNGDDSLRNCVIISLTEPIGMTGKGTPFSKQLELKDADCSYRMDGSFPIVNQTVAKVLLQRPSPFYVAGPGLSYEGYLTCAQSPTSLFLHLDGDDLRAHGLERELTEIYETWKNWPKLNASSLKPGTYVIAQQHEDPCWYRGKILEASPEQDAFTVFFLDYGNVDTVNLSMLRPMLDYFVKEPPLAFEVQLPVSLLPDVTEDVVCDMVVRFCEEQEIRVYLQNDRGRGIIYAWIFRKAQSLVDHLCNDALVKPKLQPSEHIPSA